MRPLMLLACLALPLAWPFESQADATRQPGDPSMLMDQVRAIAPPVVRDCIIAEIQKLSPLSLQEVQTRSGTGQAGMLGDALRLVGHVRASCYEHMDVDSAQEGLVDAFFNWNSFIHAFRAHGLANPYRDNEIARLLDAYNTHQDCLYGLVGPCKGSVLNGISALVPSGHGEAEPSAGFGSWPRPRGHSQISATEFERHLALTFRITVRSHTEGIDDGMDRFRTLVVRKSDLQVAGDHAAILLADSTSALGVLATNAQTSCAGTSYGDNLLVLTHDLSRVSLSAPLPPGISNIHREPSRARETLRLRVSGETMVDSPRRQACELRNWARKFDFRYTVTCGSKARRCKLERKLIRVTYGCADIGACD